ncbi:MAG TPA: hypothetical protein VMV28_07335 [Thermoplasmata archaeon]|nr:hypothetical protein [Thermoplasmata archaeon]
MNGHQRHELARRELVRDLESDGSVVIRPTGPSHVDLVRIDPSGRPWLYEIKTSVDPDRSFSPSSLTDGERGMATWAAAHGVPYVVARFHVSNAGGVETVRRLS